MAAVAGFYGGGTLLKAGAMTALALGGAAAMIGLAAGYTGLRGAEGVAAGFRGMQNFAAGTLRSEQFFGRGLGIKHNFDLSARGFQFKKMDIPFSTRQFSYPALSDTAKATIPALALGGGAVAGGYDAMSRNRWNLNQALSTGAVEVEREDFLGATGSLTIASSKNRTGARGTQAVNNGYGIPGMANMAMFADDFARPLASML
jgi:hypothetical protein